MGYGKNTYKGKFYPKNPQKYRGDINNIVYRSSWELSCLSFFDRNPNIEWYSSEELVIPYFSPADGQMHRYFIDFLYKSKSGKIVAVEVKPKAQTLPPKMTKNKKKLLQEATTYGINQAKWKAAEVFCESRGWHFRVWTEEILRKMGMKVL